MLWPVLIFSEIENKGALTLGNLLRESPESPFHGNTEAGPKANDLNFAIAGGHIIILHLNAGVLNETRFSTLPDILNAPCVTVYVQG